MTKIIIGKYKQDLKPNLEGTEVAFDFFVNIFRVNALALFFIQLVGRSEKLDSIARSAKSALSENASEFNSVQDVISGINFRWIDQFHFHESAFSEMTFCRAVDLFSIFLDDLLLYVLKCQPQSLKSNDKMTSEEVLSCSSISELVSLIAQRKVREISYKSVKDRIAYFNEKLGFNLGLSSSHINDIILLYECRNLLVHNRGVINYIFKNKVNEYTFQDGDTIEVDTELCSTAVQCLSNAVKAIDHAITEKLPASKIFSSEEDFIKELSGVMGKADKFTNEVRNFMMESSNIKNKADG